MMMNPKSYAKYKLALKRGERASLHPLQLRFRKSQEPQRKHTSI
jgi:hypothetical protein